MKEVADKIHELSNFLNRLDSLEGDQKSELLSLLNINLKDLPVLTEDAKLKLQTVEQEKGWDILLNMKYTLTSAYKAREDYYKEHPIERGTILSFIFDEALKLGINITDVEVAQKIVSTRLKDGKGNYVGRYLGSYFPKDSEKKSAGSATVALKVNKKDLKQFGLLNIEDTDGLQPGDPSVIDNAGDVVIICQANGRVERWTGNDLEEFEAEFPGTPILDIT